MKIFITGSTTGLGLLAGQMLMEEGHEVVFHARNKNSTIDPKLNYVFGDLTKMSDVKNLAREANKLGPFNAIIHNAGVYESSSEELFQVNVAAPYVLCKLMKPAKRLVFISSGLHLGGKMVLDNHKCSYADTKLFVLMLAKHFARVWPNSLVNATHPGWVPTRMGGANAPDDLVKGAETQAWLATTSDASAMVTGKYFFHKKEQRYNPLADSTGAQASLITYLDKF
jgi:NAD(P)-dependent dehydrogenase (short-subunit alcohol dehydrogenase family)